MQTFEKTTNKTSLSLKILKNFQYKKYSTSKNSSPKSLIHCLKVIQTINSLILNKKNIFKETNMIPKKKLISFDQFLLQSKKAFLEFLL